jgi:hypothetical protein
MTSPTNPFSEPKLARRKVTTDLGRQLLQKERQRLSREQALLGEQLADEAKRKAAMQVAGARQAKPEQVAISRGIVKRFAGVLASEGLCIKITAQPVERMSAWTDFEQIYIGYRMHDDVRLLAATMRGLAYHEGGHCRFTLPFTQLAELVGKDARNANVRPLHRAWNCLEDQRMETAVVSDSPRKAAYLSTTIMTELLENVNAAADNYPLIIWRRYLSKKVRRGARKLFVFKANQRGLDGEALARQWEHVVTQYVLADNAATMWEAVENAHELLKVTQVPALDGGMGHERQERKGSQRDLDDALVIPVDPSMLQEAEEMLDYDDEEAEIDLTDEDNAAHAAEVLIALWNNPESLIVVVFAAPGGATDDSPVPGEPTPAADEQGDEDGDDDDDEDGDDDSDDDDSDDEGSHASEDDRSDDDDCDDSGEDEAEDATDDVADHDDEAEDQQDGDDGDTNTDPTADDDGDEDDSDAEGDSDDETSDDDSDGVGTGDDEVDHDGDEDDDDLTDQDLEDALQEAEQQRDNDPALDGDVQAYNDAIDNRVSDLMPYETQVSTDLLAKAAAENLAIELEQSFQQATMDKAPAWVEQQKRGVLNIMRYKTRQVGDTEFFRQWTEDDQPGFNLAVSVLLDYSGSMGGMTKQLAEAGYASKLACERLGIPCTVVLWDNHAKVLWDANERAEELPVITAAGSTDPTVALADLINQRYEKAQHLVLIMTDGAWQGNQGNSGYLAAYKEEGRVFIGLGYNGGGDADDIADKLHRYGCDQSYAIRDLMDIPRQLEQTLVAMS